MFFNGEIGTKNYKGYEKREFSGFAGCKLG